MKGIENHPPPIPLDIQKLARAIRFALVSIVLAFSYFSIRSCLSMEGFERIFHDMLGGRPLPAITVFILNMYPLLLSVSILVPTAAIAILFYDNVIRSFYFIGVLGLMSAAEFILIYHGLGAPFVEIIKVMGGT